MKLRPRDIRALAFLFLGLIVTLMFRWMSSAPTAVVTTMDSPAVLQNRLAKLRKTAATVPAKMLVLKSVDAQLDARRAGILKFETAAQAQAHLLEVIHRLASTDKIAAFGGDFAPPVLFGADYGQVAVTVNFETTIEAYVNFLADLSKEPELISVSEMHVSAANQKMKTINVRLTVAGIVPKKLVPVRKGVLTL